MAGNGEGRILLAEDDAADVELALMTLGTAGLAHRVDVARDGVEALDYLRRTGRFAGRPGGAPRIVILDLRMPRLDGLATLAAIRRDADLAATPVVMFSSSPRDQDIAAAYRYGANGFVVKPVDAGEYGETLVALARFWAGINRPCPAGLRGGPLAGEH